MEPSLMAKEKVGTMMVEKGGKAKGPERDSGKALGRELGKEPPAKEKEKEKAEKEKARKVEGKASAKSLDHIQAKVLKALRRNRTRTALMATTTTTTTTSAATTRLPAAQSCTARRATKDSRRPARTPPTC
jgi:hypothetical protein